MTGQEPADTGERETQDAVENEAIERAARQRVPGSFDIAFLSGREDVTELLLVRHGQQTYDANAPAGDLIDPPLSDLGESQARLVGMTLSTQRVDAVYSSPLRRALGTAEEIACHHRIDVQIIADLREVEVFRDVPPERTPLDFIGRLALSGARERMIVEKSWDVYPYSESSHEFRKRVINAIERIIAAHRSERVVIACHGGVINAYTGHIIGSRYDMFFRPGHTSINIVGAAEGVRALYRLNDVTHLSTAEGDFASI